MSVASFGALNIDLIYSGENRLPNPGEEIYYPNFDIQLGGGSTLIPIVMNKFGINAKLGTFLGKDFLSSVAKNLLDNLKFKNYQNFYSKKGRSPVIVTSAVSLEKDRCFISYRDDQDDYFPDADRVYSFLTGSKVCFAVKKYPEVMKKLRSEGSIIVYDFGWDENMNISHYEEILKYVDIYTPNDKEALKLTGASSLEEAIKILAKYVKYPIIKVGRHGCLTIKNDKILRIGMPCFFNAIDTTGSGDNFMAGVVYSLCQSCDWNILDCMKMGNVFGGISTTELGCYRGIMSQNVKNIVKYMKLYC